MNFFVLNNAFFNTSILIEISDSCSLCKSDSDWRYFYSASS